MRAAGMEPRQEKPKRFQADEILGRPVEETILAQRSQGAPLVKSAHYKSVLYIGDAHFPFVSQDVLCLIYEYIERYKPEVVVQVGDLFDFAAQTRFPASKLVIFNPFEEARLGRKMAGEMWETIRRLVPKAELFQIWGNHDLRPIKRILESAPDCEPFFDLKPYMTFDGVQTVEDYRSALKINETNVHHGWLSKLGAHRDHFMTNTVVGHSHRAGIDYRKFGDRVLWEMNVGFIGDAHSKALGYTPTRMTNWTLGFGTEDALGPRIVLA